MLSSCLASPCRCWNILVTTILVLSWNAYTTCTIIISPVFSYFSSFTYCNIYRNTCYCCYCFRNFYIKCFILSWCPWYSISTRITNTCWSSSSNCRCYRWTFYRIITFYFIWSNYIITRIQISKFLWSVFFS